MNSLDRTMRAVNELLASRANSYAYRETCLVRVGEEPIEVEETPQLTHDQIARLLSVHACCPVSLDCISEVLRAND